MKGKVGKNTGQPENDNSVLFLYAVLAVLLIILGIALWVTVGALAALGLCVFTWGWYRIINYKPKQK